MLMIFMHIYDVESDGADGTRSGELHDLNGPPPKSFDDLADRYGDMIYGIALTQVRHRQDAEDVLQDTFLAYYRKERSFHEEEHRKAWLIRTTLNCCRKSLSLSARRRLAASAELAPDDTDAPGGEWIFRFATREENDVFQTLRGLPEKYRTVLYLHYFEDLQTDVIARTLRIKPGTVRAQLVRAREMMRILLEGAGYHG